jgi:hypothetical protein
LPTETFMGEGMKREYGKDGKDGEDGTDGKSSDWI